MDEYTLYLDESYNNKKTKFTIAGIIIKNTQLKLLDSKILDAKKCIWDEEYIINNSPILHCVDLTKIKDNRNNEKSLPQILKKYGHYNIWINKTPEFIKSAYDNTFSKLSETIKSVNGVVLGCLIDINKISFLYGNQIRDCTDLLFEIGIQSIIENYAHFLDKNKSVGNIIYESRNGESGITYKSDDIKMFNNFCKIKINNKGISFLEEDIIIKTINHLTAQSKKENISGLQLADFIAYDIIKNYNNSSIDQNAEFTKQYISRLYNGTYELDDRDLRYYFGLKIIPFDFKKVKELETENKKLKNSNNNLKRENRNLIKKNKLLIEKKEKLLEENKNLKNQLTK